MELNNKLSEELNENVNTNEKLQRELFSANLIVKSIDDQKLTHVGKMRQEINNIKN